jgi:hypothetical protein
MIEINKKRGSLPGNSQYLKSMGIIQNLRVRFGSMDKAQAGAKLV